MVIILIADFCKDMQFIVGWCVKKKTINSLFKRNERNSNDTQSSERQL